MPRSKHGMYRTATYRRWVYMKRRCAKDPKYTSQGIRVCGRWAESFEAFLEDMGEVPDGMTLDRIDGTKGYELGNCRWATYKEQNRNLRTNVWVDGKVVADIADETGLSRTAIVYRANRKLPIYAPRIEKRAHCKAGHLWDEANTYYATVKKRGGGTRVQRYCRKCRAAHQATRRAELAQLNPKRT